MNALSLPKSISMLPSPTPLHTTNIKTNQPPISPKLKSPRQPAVKRGGNSHSNDMTSSSDKLLLPLPTNSTTPKSAIPIKKSKKCTTTGDHLGNFYLIHLEREATEDEHREIARFVTDNQVFQLVGNVMIVGKPNRATYRGPTMLATTLHAMAILLRIDAKWDWFINLSASDYPLVTQDASFGIPLHSLFEAKGIAGNIVHAVATTNAIIAGLIVIEAIKVLRNDAKNCRMTYCLEHPARKMLLMPVEPFEPNKSCYVCSETPLLLEVNTQRAKLRDVVEKVVTSKLGMNLPLITHGSSLLYEVGDDLDQDMVANYEANLEKVLFQSFRMQ